MTTDSRLGVQKYSNHDIVQFLEGIGAQFGACQNAHTSFDETVYELMVPKKDLQQALTVFAQFAEKIRQALSPYSTLTPILLSVCCNSFLSVSLRWISKYETRSKVPCSKKDFLFEMLGSQAQCAS